MIRTTNTTFSPWMAGLSPALGAVGPMSEVVGPRSEVSPKPEVDGPKSVADAFVGGALMNRLHSVAAVPVAASALDSVRELFHFAQGSSINVPVGHLLMASIGVYVFYDAFKRFRECRELNQKSLSELKGVASKGWSVSVGDTAAETVGCSAGIFVMTGSFGFIVPTLVFLSFLSSDGLNAILKHRAIVKEYHRRVAEEAAKPKMYEVVIDDRSMYPHVVMRVGEALPDPEAKGRRSIGPRPSQQVDLESLYDYYHRRDSSPQTSIPK